MIINGIRLTDLLHRYLNDEKEVISATAMFKKDSNTEHRLTYNGKKFFNPAKEFEESIEINKIQALDDIDLIKVTIEKEIIFL